MLGVICDDLADAAPENGVDQDVCVENELALQPLHLLLGTTQPLEVLNHSVDLGLIKVEERIELRSSSPERRHICLPVALGGDEVTDRLPVPSHGYGSIGVDVVRERSAELSMPTLVAVMTPSDECAIAVYTTARPA